MRKRARELEDLAVEVSASRWNLKRKISDPYGRGGNKGQTLPSHFTARGRQLEAWNA